MITSRQDYYNFLIDTQALNPTRIAALPFANNDKICEVDLDSRKINSPEFLSIQYDHKSEVIYFKLNRFYDYMDLSTTTCLIQYIDAHKEPHIYVVPYFDINTYSYEDKMLIPWSLDCQATAYEGIIQYSICFYKIKNVLNEETQKIEPKIIYKLNTNMATGKVLHGMNVLKDENGKPVPQFDLEATFAEEVLAEVQRLSRKELTWIDLY